MESIHYKVKALDELKRQCISLNAWDLVSRLKKPKEYIYLEKLDNTKQ